MSRKQEQQKGIKQQGQQPSKNMKKQSSQENVEEAVYSVLVIDDS